MPSDAIKDFLHIAFSRSGKPHGENMKDTKAVRATVGNLAKGEI